jgi:hypothetical protein
LKILVGVALSSIVVAVDRAKRMDFLTITTGFLKIVLRSSSSAYEYVVTYVQSHPTRTPSIPEYSFV